MTPLRTVKAVVANRARPWRARTTRSSSQVTRFTHLSAEAKIAPNGGASKPKQNSSPVLFAKKNGSQHRETIVKPRLEITVFFKMKIGTSLNHPLSWTWHAQKPEPKNNKVIISDLPSVEGILGSQLGKPWRCPPWCEKGAITIGQFKLAFHDFLECCMKLSWKNIALKKSILNLFLLQRWLKLIHAQYRVVSSM